MRLYVKAIDEVLHDKVILKVENGEVVEVINPHDFKPDPFSRVVNVLKGHMFEVGIYKYKVVGEHAYTRQW
jgi:hypothetical protein